MPQESSFRRLKGYHTTRTSAQHSVSSLGIDLKKDTLSILQDLLTGIYNDFMVIYQPYNRSDPTNDVSTQQRIAARLNVLVLISKRVFQVLSANSSLRIPLLQAVYHILRLPLWHYNRSLRCSALRCLRYYVHSAQDMVLLLKCRLDLLISRCMDLSYYQNNVVPSNKLIGNSALRGVDYHHQPHHHRARFVIPYDSPTTVSSHCQPSEQSSCYRGNEGIDQINELSRKGVGVTRFRRSSPAKDYSGISIKSSLTTRNNIESSYMPGATSERPAVLRLIYHLVNLSPHLIPPSLIHAIAAPCLDALNYTIMSPDDKRGFRGGGGAGRGHACVVTGGLRRRTSPTAIIQYPLCPGGDMAGIGMKLNDTNYDTEVDTTTIRSCLLILSELVILAPERLTVDTSSSFVRHSKIKSPAYCFHQENDSTAPGNNSNNATKEPLSVVGRTIIHALMSTFAYTSTMYTYHSSRIHEAVMLTLITILNRSDYAQFLPNRVISKFFVAYTSTSHSLLHRKSSFDTYPSFTLCARNALILMFRSWPGIFHFTRDGVSNLKTLLYTLAVGSTENRNQILDLLYSLFPTIPVPHPSVKDMEPTILGLIEALSTGSSSLLPVIYAPNSSSRKKTNIFTTPTDEMSSLPKSRRFVSSILPVRRPSSSSSSNIWDIDGGFIAAEGCRLFSKYDSVGFDVMNNYYALLLAILIQAGLYEALMRAISDSNQVTSIRAGYLLGSLAYKVESLLPHEHPVCKRLHQVGLLRPETPGSQLAVLWLERIHRVMQSHEARLRDPSNFISVPYHSPFLECLAKRSVDASSSSSRHSAFTDHMELTEATLDHLIASSNVLSFKAKSQHGRFSQCQMTTTCCSSKPPDVWDWDILTTLGRRLAVTRTTFSWESKSRSKFLRCLMEFLTPDETYRRDLTCSSEKYAPALPTIGRSLSAIPNKATILPADSLFSVVINGNRSCLQQNLDYCTNLQGIDRLLYNRENKLFNNNDNNICKESNPKDDNFNRLNPHLINSSNANLNLAWLSHDWPHASAAGILASGLISHLAYYSPTSEPSQFLDRFLTVLHLCLKYTLSKITTDSSINGENLPEEKSSSDNSTLNNNNIDNTNDNANLILLFTPKLLNKSCSSLILLAASQLTTSDVGESRLEKSDLCIDFQSILMFPSKLKRHGTSVTTDSQKYFLCHAKVILSSLDYSRPSKMSRMLLTTAAIQGIRALRIYTIRLIRLLFRLKLPFLASWCIDLVVKLCMDPSKKVRRLALCLLEELCWDPANVQALSQNILQRNSQMKDKRSSILTCFAAYLLNTSTGPIGHRIFSRVLSITNVFDQLYMHKIIKQPNSLVGYFYDARERNNNNSKMKKNCRVPSDNPHDDFIDTSPDNDKLSSVINFTPRPPGDENDDGHDAEANDTNGENGQASILCDPINWILDIAKKYYNEAYAKDMDTRLTSMFVTYETRKSTNASYGNDESDSKNSLLPVISIIGLEKSSYVNFTTDNDENDRDRDHDDDDDDLEDGVDHPSNTEFTFEDNYFIEGADNNVDDDDGRGTYYLPPPLSTARSVSCHQLSNGCDSYHCLALLKHPYGCLAEHRHGIDLLDKRMDLELAVANIRSYESRLSSRSTTTMMDENFEKSSINDTNTLLKLKADMWALAHACSTSFGQLWLSKHPELVKLFTNLTLHSNTMSVRAIAWICLNLITSCPNGYFRRCKGSSISAKTQQACSEPLDCDELTNDWPFIPYIDNNNNNNNNNNNVGSNSNKNNENENVNSNNLEFHTTLQSSTQLDAVKFDQDAFQSNNGLLSDVYDVVGPSVHYETEHKTDKHVVVDRKSSKPSIRSQVIENFNRSRRRWWFHRHCSPNHRRFSPPACESSSCFSSNPQQQQHHISCNRSNHSSLTSSSQFPAFTCEIPPHGNSSLLSSSQQPYLTWTHRNCIQHRQTVLTAPLPSSRLSPVCDRDTMNNDNNNKSIIDHSWTSSADVYLTNKRQLICLPKDIHILGNKKSTTVENTDQFIQQSPMFANQSFTCRQFDHLRCSMALSNAQKSSSKPSRSFIDVAVDAQMLLSAYSQRKCSSTLSSIPADEISVDTSNPDGVINSGTSDNENQLYSSDSIQVTGTSNYSSSHDDETSRKVSLKSDELMKQISVPPLSSSNSLPPSESCLLHKDAESRPPPPTEGKLDVISNWLISSDDVNKTNLATSENIKLSSHNNTPTETLMYPNTPLDPSPILNTANDTDSEDDKANNKAASGGKSSCHRQSSGFSPDGCLSLSCLASLNVDNDCQCDEAVLTEQDIWYNQLVDSICSLMPSVFSSSRGDTGLDHLIKKAVKVQQTSKGAIQLFNACTYTLIADLLGAYTFSRQARTKIQSVFLCFQLDELLVDANNSLTELEKYLTSSNR
ncbi:unnamed protein product [Trichobilharzia szidati]|nr:unnamed protein product [Trichobilharzia szidati]